MSPASAGGSYPLHHEGSLEPSFNQRKRHWKVSTQTRNTLKKEGILSRKQGPSLGEREGRKSKLGRKQDQADNWAGLKGKPAEEGAFKSTT